MRQAVKCWKSARERGRPSIAELLQILGKRRMTNILVEGGAEVFGSFFDAKVVDEVWADVAPIIAGGPGKSPVGGIGVDKVATALSLSDLQVVTLENNILLHSTCRR